MITEVLLLHVLPNTLHSGFPSEQWIIKQVAIIVKDTMF